MDRLGFIVLLVCSKILESDSMRSVVYLGRRIPLPEAHRNEWLLVGAD